MAVCLGLLAFVSVFGGYLLKDLFIGLGSPFQNNAVLYITTPVEAQISGECLSGAVRIIPFIGAICSIVYVFVINNRLILERMFLLVITTDVALVLYRFMSYKWYFDVVYNNFINMPVLHGAYSIVFVTLDRGFLECVGPTGLGAFTIAKAGAVVANTQTGKVQAYGGVLLLVAGLCAFCLSLPTQQVIFVLVSIVGVLVTVLLE
jgi:NADH-ubiquinone oxidoreductase chain 5